MPHEPTSIYHVGLRNAGSYQVSAEPYLTGNLSVPASGSEPIQIEFPNVSRFVIITNTTPNTVANMPMRFGFSANGVKGIENHNYCILNNGESFEAEFKVVDVFLMSDNNRTGTACVIAGLTGIPEDRLLGNWSGSAGVG